MPRRRNRKVEPTVYQLERMRGVVRRLVREHKRQEIEDEIEAVLVRVREEYVRVIALLAAQRVRVDGNSKGEKKEVLH
jgi:hypothetical protein